MAVGDRQIFITELVSKALDEDAKSVSFDWLINKHHQEHFQSSYDVICNIYSAMGGASSDKRISRLSPDAYFGGKYNFLFEFDEIQHFTTARLNTFNHYPKELKLNYSMADWVKYCNLYSHKSNKFYARKTSADFKFDGGRRYTRAYLDCFRDLLPQHHGLKPTLRISAFEVQDISTINVVSIGRIKRLLDNKLKHL